MYNSKTVRFSAKCYKKVRSGKSGSTILLKILFARVGLEMAVKDETIFFEKEDFLKNGYGYDFETFTNGFLAKNCIRISCHPKTNF